MFLKQDFDSLTEVFSAARAYIATAQPSNRDSLASILNFETELKQKMIDTLPKEEETKDTPEVDMKEPASKETH